MFCEQCGKQMSEQSLFCPNCGNKNSSKVEDVKPGREPIPVFVPDPVVEPVETVVTPVVVPVSIPEPVIKAESKKEAIQSTKKEKVVKEKAEPKPKVEKEVIPEDLTKPLSVLGYLGTFLLLFIPVANIVLLFIWAFSSNVNKNKKNFAIAYLILMVVVTVLTVIFGATAVVLLGELLEDMMY